MPKRTRTDYTLLEKIDVLDRYHKLPSTSQRDSADTLGVKRGFLRNLLRDEEKLRSEHGGEQNQISSERKRQRSGKDSAVEDALYKWFEFARSRKAPVNGPILCQKAEMIAHELGHREFKATDGWFGRWKLRHELKHIKVQGEAADADVEAATEWKTKNLHDILKQYTSDNIFNADETGFYFRALPDTTYVQKSQRRNARGIKLAKDRLTILVCCSMAGEKIKPLVIGKSKNPRCLKNVRILPVLYKSSSNAWMTKDIWSEWLKEWDKNLRKENRNILLLIDNCSAHVDVSGLTYINVVRLPPNTTSLIQPCDMGIIRTLKAYCRHEMRKEIIDQLEDTSRELSANDLAKKLNILDGMRMISRGWSNVSEQTIVNCWKKAGLVPKENGDETEENQEVDILLPEGMSVAEFDSWIQIDSDIQTDEEITFEEEERQFLRNLTGKDDTDEIEDGDESGDVIDVDESEPEKNPTNTEMRQCLHRLLVGLENRQFSDMDGFHRLSDQIKETLRESMKERPIHFYFKQ